MSPSVYLLDDDAEILAMLSDVVKLSGLVPVSYTRGKDLLEIVNVFTGDSILILDLQMPQMDGIEVMRKLVEAQKLPRLILISGQDVGVLHSAEQLAAAHGLEVITTLTKPLSIEYLIKVLRGQVFSHSSIKPSFGQISADNLTSERLRYAIDNNQMVLHYQPQFSLADESLIGLEALVRWNHPEHGLTYPDSFISLAEQNDTIGILTQWVIDQVVRQAHHWQEQGIPVHVSVNISAKDITSLTLPEHLAKLLSSTGLDPSLLMLELTESALMAELVTSLEILTRLRLKGIKLSIDDFGTGFSSLSQLHKVPFSELKIDHSFIEKMCHDEEAHAIVKTCIILGHELKMTVIAEGVETRQQINALSELGCDLAQGFYFGRPAPVEEINKILQNPTRKISTW